MQSFRSLAIRLLTKPAGDRKMFRGALSVYMHPIKKNYHVKKGGVFVFGLRPLLPRQMPTKSVLKWNVNVSSKSCPGIDNEAKGNCLLICLRPARNGVFAS